MRVLNKAEVAPAVAGNTKMQSVAVRTHNTVSMRISESLALRKTER